MGLIGFASVLALLHSLAAAIENERRVLDLRTKAAALRRRFERQLRGEDVDDVIEVDEAPPMESAKAA